MYMNTHLVHVHVYTCILEIRSCKYAHVCIHVCVNIQLIPLSSFLGCCYPNQLEMEQLRNEDLCMILIDRGVVEDHLPNHVLDSLVRFRQQSLGQHYREEEVEGLREVRRRERQEHSEARKKTNTAGSVHVHMYTCVCTCA